MNLIDYDVLNALKGMLGDDLLGITGFFNSSIHDEVQALTRLCDSNDFDAIRNKAHAIKGSAGGLGAVELSRVAASIEKLAKELDQNSMFPFLEQLPSVTELTLIELRKGGFIPT